MRHRSTAPRRSLQIRILASVLLGLGIVVLGQGALAFKTTRESTRHALSERLALAQTVQQGLDREILASLQFARRLSSVSDLRDEREFLQWINLTDLLDSATVIGADGQARRAVARHGAPQAPLPLLPRGPGLRQIFPITGGTAAVGFAVPMASGDLMLARMNGHRLQHLLVAHREEGDYTAQLLGPDGSQIAEQMIPAEAARRHVELLAPLRKTATAGIVMHSVPDHRFDHYIAYAPLAALPGWGVTVEQPRDVVVALPQRLRALILTLGLLTLLAGGAVAWLDVRRVVTPLRSLARDAERIGAGDLATPIRTSGQDEIAVLAGSLDRMRAALGDSLEEIRRRETRARALHEVGTGILRSREDGTPLELIVGAAHDLLEGDVALLCLFDAESRRVRLAAVAGAAEAILVRDSVACPPPDLVGCGILARDFRAGHLVAPVQAGATLLGWLCVGVKTPRSFSDDDRTLLESLGTLAALALENLRLRAEVRWLGAIQERERLARELHDGLAQALAIIYAYAQGGAHDGKARRALTRITEVSTQAYEEVRQAIYGLRLGRNTDLGSALGEYVHEFSRQTGLQVELVTEGPRTRDRLLTALPLEVEVQVVRIVQEALANVWRHAHARKAIVRFAQERRDVVVSVEDDGVGFVVDEVTGGRRHFGLLTMTERAGGVGGRLTIASEPGRGTRVTARLPAVAKEVAPWIRSA